MDAAAIIGIFIVVFLVAAGGVVLLDKQRRVRKIFRLLTNRLEFSGNICAHCGAKLYYDYTPLIHDNETGLPRIYLRKEHCSNCSIPPNHNEVVMTRKMYLNRNDPDAEQSWLTDLKIEDLLPKTGEEIESFVDELDTRSRRPDNFP